MIVSLNPYFVADHPFIFIIQDNESGTYCSWARSWILQNKLNRKIHVVIYHIQLIHCINHGSSHRRRIHICVDVRNDMVYLARDCSDEKAFSSEYARFVACLLWLRCSLMRVEHIKYSLEWWTGRNLNPQWFRPYQIM